MTGEAGKQVLLFVTHRLSKHLIGEFDRLREGFYDPNACFIVFHDRGIREDGAALLGGRPAHVVSDQDLRALGYAAYRPGRLVPGSNHFLTIHFVRAHPQHAYYWSVEYDVRFSGRWVRFFEHFRRADEDFLSAHVQRHADQPRWPWWDLRHGGAVQPPGSLSRSFNPIYRVSAKALGYIDRCHQAGWTGHHEVLIPSLLYQTGFRLRDFGGKGEFVRPGDQDRFYLHTARGDLHGSDLAAVAGTGFKLRYLWGCPRNHLFHPVKRRRLGYCLELLALAARS
jgi:hypothetical protein